MDTFGVVEVATERRAVAPGWAYVPDVSTGLSGAATAAAAAAASAHAKAVASASAAEAAAEMAGAGGAGASETAGGALRKRAARSSQAMGGSLFARQSDLTARQEAKLRRELELLDRDPGVVSAGGGVGSGGGSGGGRDATIPIPARFSKAQNKYTPNVRKILASQKTFANYLSDFHALYENGNHGHGHGHGHSLYAHGHGEGGVAGGGGGDGAGARAGSSSASRRPPKKDAKRDAKREAAAKKEKKSETTTTTTTTGRRDPPKRGSRRSMAAAAAAAAAASAANPETDADTPMPDAAATLAAATADDPVPKTEDAAADTPTTAAASPAPALTPTPIPNPSAILLPYTGPRPPPHPLDDDPLLASRMPLLPSDDVLRALVAAPPLTYDEARASWDTGDAPPVLVVPGVGAGVDAGTPDRETGRGGSSAVAVPLPPPPLPPPAPERRYPARVFCEICGYWGRVKCTKCGTPVCALDCLTLHREECVTRYGY